MPDIPAGVPAEFAVASLCLVSAGRTPGVSGAGLRWLAKKDLLVQPLGWAMWGSGVSLLRLPTAWIDSMGSSVNTL